MRAISGLRPWQRVVMVRRPRHHRTWRIAALRKVWFKRLRGEESSGYVGDGEP